MYKRKLIMNYGYVYDYGYNVNSHITITLTPINIYLIEGFFFINQTNIKIINYLGLCL